MIAAGQHNVSDSRPLRGGFTLAELVLSMGIMAILMGGMASAILVATHALPDDQGSSEAGAEAVEIVDQIAGELLYATAITEEAENAVTFTVADRNHGAAGPETIRYEWSGTPGDPLTREYNGATAVKICEEVQLFSLRFFRQVTQLQGPPSVLLVVDDAVGPCDAEIARQTTIEGWGFPVQLISAWASQAEFDAAAAVCDVAYICATVQAADLNTKLRDKSIGVVNEVGGLYDDLGFFSSDSTAWLTDIEILDDTHEITWGLGTGTLTLFPAAEPQLTTSGTVAAGVEVLAEVQVWKSPILAVIKVDGALYGGGQAAGRRVKLPWGRADVDFDSLNSDGRELMRRAIVWAAAPVIYSGVRIELQPTADSARLRTQTSILNLPKANGS
ncbi:MAG: prepilin-type N-terminal cleavage/methylation domain-containing protein [Planctomycetes bacterium]|nr:prepilin-type N-terminal cleavage/methylation domain-containing protein [Planctomycetota bacterium]